VHATSAKQEKIGTPSLPFDDGCFACPNITNNENLVQVLGNIAFVSHLSEEKRVKDVHK
jgi:hypothetical protein